MRRRPTTLRADLALVGAAFLFGSTFLVVQDAVAREEVDVSAFLAARFAFATLALLPLAVVRGRPRRGLGRSGAAAGLALASGYVLQTLGLEHTTSSVSAFITYLLVVFVPLLSAVALRRPPLPSTLLGVALAVVGLALLVAGAGGEAPGGLGGFGIGEVLTLACALGFAVHIVVLAALVGRYDIVQLNAVQCAVVAGVLVLPGLLGGGYAFPAPVWLAAAYTGVAVTALAFGLQMYGQRRVSASRTALVLMLEPVFAGAIGYAAGERLGGLGALGAVVILGAILVSEVAGARSASPGDERGDEPAPVP